MELCEKLKELRKKRGVSQQELADAIFVSRSAVAKWESGKGSPSKDAITALGEFYNVPDGYLVTDEPENVIVKKNKRVIVNRIVTAVVMVWIVAFSIFLLHRFNVFEGYGFTSKQTAEVFEDNTVVHTDKYDFYYHDITSDESINIGFFCAVKKLLIGYKYQEIDEYRRVYNDDKLTGILFHYKAQDKYYWVFLVAFPIGKGEITPDWILEFDTLTANGEEIPVEVNSIFVTDEWITEFYVDGHLLTVDDEINYD